MIIKLTPEQKTAAGPAKAIARNRHIKLSYLV